VQSQNYGGPGVPLKKSNEDSIYQFNNSHIKMYINKSLLNGQINRHL